MCVEARAAAPLIRLAMFRDPVLSASLAMSALVSTVMMATLVVGPFYLARARGLDATLVGLVMSVGPLAAALSGVPAGRLVDRLGAQFMTIVGLMGMAAGSVSLFVMPASFGYPRLPRPDHRHHRRLCAVPDRQQHGGDVRDRQRHAARRRFRLLNLSRNLGLITGASLMGAVFALAAANADISTATPEAVADGMRITFAVAARWPP